MKRLIISITIIGVIVAVGIYALSSVSQKNERLYGLVEEVLNVYNEGKDPSSKIDKLSEYVNGPYAHRLAYFVEEDELQEIRLMISRLKPMIESGCDEFTAECKAILVAAEHIFLDEFPAIYRIL